MNRAICVQFVNTLSRLDGGPALHATEVNFGLNRIDVPTRLIALQYSGPDSVVHGLRGRQDFPKIRPIEGLGSFANLSTAAKATFYAKIWIIHGYFIWWTPIVSIFAAILRKKLFIMPHGALTAFDRKRHRVRKLIFIYLLGGLIVLRRGFFLVATQREATELPKAVQAARIAVVGAGTESQAAPELRGLSTPVTLLSLSRIAPKKRIDVSIQTTAELLRRGHDVQLVVAGDGDVALLDSLQTLAEDLNINERVAFVGGLYGDAKRAAFVNADIFIAPSDDENFGISTAEALMCGLPIVASENVNAVQGIHSNAGALVAGTDPKSYADAVESLLENYAERRLAAWTWANNSYSWDAVAHRWKASLSAATRFPKDAGTAGRICESGQEQ